MSKERSSAARDYELAHAIHYTERDLLRALRAYAQVIDQYAGAREADYSRAQIRNIVHSVVPAEEILAAHTALALDHLAPAADRGTASSSY